MRMRNLPWAKDYLASSPSTIKTIPENWSEFFQKQREEKNNASDHALLHVELGAGKGGFSAKLAKLLPQDNFVALEKKQLGCSPGCQADGQGKCHGWKSCTA